MNYLFVITAKKNSKRLPNKNSRIFKGKPLVEWTILHCLSIEQNPVVVSDDDFILDLGEKYNLRTLREPEEFTNNHHGLFGWSCKQLNWTGPIVLGQVTGPNRDPKDFIRGMEMFDSGNYDAIYSGYVLKGKTLHKENGEYFSSHCDLPGLNPLYKDKIYVGDSSVAIFSAEVVAGNIPYYLYPRIGFLPVDPIRASDIDEQSDWDEAERYFEFLQQEKNVSNWK